VLPAFQPAVEEWLQQTFAHASSRTTERRLKKARMQARRSYSSNQTTCHGRWRVFIRWQDDQEAEDRTFWVLFVVSRTQHAKKKKGGRLK
jgi:hypothetical protein